MSQGRYPFLIMENLEHDTVVWFGGEVKALNDEGKIGGYLVRFSTQADPDLAGDFFTKDTDFGPIKSSPILYHHGMDAAMKGRRLGQGDLKMDDVGVWMEGQLALRDRYEKAVFEMAKQGKLGWSSGTAAHLVEREAVGKSWRITSWPLGLDASLTPTPCNPRTTAIPLKSYIAEFLPAETEPPETAAQAVEHTVDVKDAAVTPISTAKTKTMENVNDTGAENVKATEPTPSQVVQPTSIITLSKADYDQLQAKAFSQPVERVVKAAFDVSSANVNLKTKPGDSFTKAYTYWVRTGDQGSVKSLQVEEEDGNRWGMASKASDMVAIKASNDTDMNVGTAADGGNAVPTGHFQQIIARRDESSVAQKLGIRNIPGRGTTVNVPLDAEGDGEFISTAEAAANDRDAPALGTKAMTLAKYTKLIELSDELLIDEDSQLLAFISDFIGRGMAKTHNNLIVTEAAANGTSTKTFASATTIAAGELQDMMYNSALEPYLDDAGSVAWLTRRSTHGVVAKLQGSDFIYDATPQGSGAGRTLLGTPIAYSEKVAALATTNKPIFLANWYFMGVRNEPEFRVLRDPYSAATTGQLRLHYYFRTIYGVLQAEAITYGTLA